MTRLKEINTATPSKFNILNLTVPHILLNTQDLARIIIIPVNSHTAAIPCKWNNGGFFIHTTTVNQSKRNEDKVLRILGTQIVFIAPIKIELGECRLEVRMLPHGNKNVQKGVLPDALTVVE
jgi:hypothetical protein